MLEKLYKIKITKTLEKAEKYYQDNYHIFNSSSFHHSLENNQEYFVFGAKLKMQKWDEHNMSSCIFISRNAEDLSVGNVVEDLSEYSIKPLNLGAIVKLENGIIKTVQPGYSDLFEYAKSLHKLSQEERFQSKDENAIKMKENIILTAKHCVIKAIKQSVNKIDNTALAKNLKHFNYELIEMPLDAFISKYESAIYFLKKYKSTEQIKGNQHSSDQQKNL